MIGIGVSKTLSGIEYKKMEKEPGIYIIKSNTVDKIYVGSAINLIYRERQHRSRLKNNTHCNNILQNHFNKYGDKDLVFYKLEDCEKDELIIREQFFIDTLQPQFNICKVAGSKLNTRLSDITKVKIGNANKGRSPSNKGKKQSEIEIKSRIDSRINGAGWVCSEATRNKISRAKIGTKVSAITKQKLSLLKKDYYQTDRGKEHRALSSEFHKGKCFNRFSSETREKMSKSHLGKPLSEETKKKISEKNKGRISPMLGKLHTEDTKKKMSLNNKGEKNYFYGKKHSEVTKEKIRQARLLALSKKNNVVKSYTYIETTDLYK